MRINEIIRQSREHIGARLNGLFKALLLHTTGGELTVTRSGGQFDMYWRKFNNERDIPNGMIIVESDVHLKVGGLFERVLFTSLNRASNRDIYMEIYPYQNWCKRVDLLEIGGRGDKLTQILLCFIKYTGISLTSKRWSKE